MKARIGMGLAIAALVLAPVGAGATGHNALAMLAFAGVYFLANAVIRPGAVRLDDLGTTALQLVTASAFAALLVGFGQTLRALGQLESDVALVGWVVVAAWGAVLGRLVWRASMGETATRTAEKTLRVVHEAGHKSERRTRRKPRKAERKAAAPLRAVPDANRQEASATPAPEPRDAPPKAEPPAPALAEALARINALPDTGGSEAKLVRAMTSVSGAAPLGAVFAALSTRAPHTERDRRALVLHALDPWVVEQRLGKGEPAQAFEAVVAAADAVALADFATRALALLDDLPEARADMPEIPRLLEIADQIETDLETQSELLVVLAHKIEDLTLEAEHTAQTGGAETETDSQKPGPETDADTDPETGRGPRGDA